MCKEHETVHRQMLDIWQKMEEHRPTDLMQRTLMRQCEVAWSIVYSIQILYNKQQGMAAMILCRSIFERTAAMHFLANSTNQQVLTDYIDYGKVIVYEVEEGREGATETLTALKPEYDSVKARFGRKKWHKRSIEKLVEASFNKALRTGETSLYKTFYKEASSLAHGDSYAVLRYSPRNGWYQTLDSKEQQSWTIRALSLAQSFFAALLFQVQKRCEMGLESEFDAIIPALEQLPLSA